MSYSRTTKILSKVVLHVEMQKNYSQLSAALTKRFNYRRAESVSHSVMTANRRFFAAK